MGFCFRKNFLKSRNQENKHAMNLVLWREYQARQAEYYGNRYESRLREKLPEANIGKRDKEHGQI